MPVDKFGRMSDTKTRDTGVSLTYINNNYIRSDGTTEITGNLNMASHTIGNLGNPMKPKDAVTKEYVDNTKGIETIERNFKHLIAVHASYTGPLIKNEYQFTFGGNKTEKNVHTGFLMPHSGRIKKIKMKTPITKERFEEVVIKRDRADVDFISKGFFGFTKQVNGKYIDFDDDGNKEWVSYDTVFIGSIVCYDAYKLYVKGNPDFDVFHHVSYDFCFDDPLPLDEIGAALEEGDVINIMTLIDLDFSKYGLDSIKDNTYLATFLIELDPL